MNNTLPPLGRLLCLLGLILPIAPHLEAQSPQRQRVDTLRRELTVHTDEAVKLGEQTPLPLSFEITPMQAMPSSRGHMSAAPRLSEGFGLSPLSSLGRLVGQFAPSPMRGYINLRAGISPHLGLRAGYRPIASERERLDLSLSTLFSSYTPYQGLFNDLHARENDFRIHGDYKRKATSSLWSIAADYRHHGYNYYGAVIEPRFYTDNPNGLDREKQHLLGKEHLFGHYLSTSVGLSSLPDQGSSFAYDLRAGLDYSSISRRKLLGSPAVSIGEIRPSLEANARVGIGGDHSLGAHIEVSALLYSRNLPPVLMATPSGERINKTQISLAPYWQVEGQSWQIRAGVGLSNDSSVEGGSLFLWPYLDAELTFAETWCIRAQADGGVEENHLARLAQLMPYRTRGVIGGSTQVRHQSRLSLSGSIARALSLELYAGYSLRQRDLNFAAQTHEHLTPYYSSPTLIEGLPPYEISGVSPLDSRSIYAIEFSPYYTDVRHLSLGGHLGYSHHGLWRAQLSASYHNYQGKNDEVVSGRPSWVIDASYEYMPVKDFSLKVSYELRSGILYRYLPKKSTEELEAMHLIHLGLVYKANSHISLQGQLSWMPNSKSTLYYGYRMQQTMVSAGINVNF